MSAEFAWSKKELHSLTMLVIANKTTGNSDLLVRAAITLLYAHWEGFIKQIGGFYLEYVARRRLKNKELSSNFLALALSLRARDAIASGKIQASLELVKFFRSNAGSRSKLKWKLGIDMKANLKASVFQEIVTTLGLNYSRFSTKEKMIDEKLLGNRNRIAHGQYLLLGIDEYLGVHDDILGIMQDFYNQIENAVITSAYRM